MNRKKFAVVKTILNNKITKKLDRAWAKNTEAIEELRQYWRETNQEFLIDERV